MAQGLSTYEANNLLNWLRGTTHPAAPATLYISLHTADPGASGANEASGNGYARVAVTGASGFTAPTTVGNNQQSTSTAVITFPASTPGTYTVGWWGIWDASSGGNFLAHAPLNTSYTTIAGAQPQFAVGALVLNAGIN